MHAFNTYMSLFQARKFSIIPTIVNIASALTLMAAVSM